MTLSTLAVHGWTNPEYQECNNVPGYAIFQLYRGGQFYWWRKPDYPEKITDLQKVRQTLSHNV